MYSSSPVSLQTLTRKQIKEFHIPLYTILNKYLNVYLGLSAPDIFCIYLLTVSSLWGKLQVEQRWSLALFLLYPKCLEHAGNSVNIYTLKHTHTPHPVKQSELKWQQFRSQWQHTARFHRVLSVTRTLTFTLRRLSTYRNRSLSLLCKEQMEKDQE